MPNERLLEFDEVLIMIMSASVRSNEIAWLNIV